MLAYSATRAIFTAALIILGGHVKAEVQLAGRILQTVATPGSDRVDRSVPLGMVSGDFNEDGAADVIGLFAAPEGGFLQLWCGNAEAIFPDNNFARAAGQALLIPQGTAQQLPARPELSLAGFIDGDRHLDLVVARKGSDELFVLRGRGDGTFRAAKRHFVEGSIAAFELIRVASSSSEGIAVAVNHAQSAQLSLLEWARDQSLRSVLDVALIEKVTALTAGLFAASGRQLAVAMNSKLQIIDPAKSGEVLAEHGIESVIDMVAANLTETAGDELALLSGRGELRIQSALSGTLLAHQGSGQSLAGRLTPVRLSGALENIAVMASGDDAVRLLRFENGSFTQSHSADRPGMPVELLGLRLNSDALPDLVLLNEDGSLEVAVSAFNRTHTVNLSSNETIEPSDGLCDVDLVMPGLQCTFREAMRESQQDLPQLLDLVKFDLPGDPPYHIQLDSCLDDLFHPTVIDGTLHPDFMGTPFVEITLSADCGGRGMFSLDGNSMVFRGLVLNDLLGGNEGFDISGDFNIIEGNYLGFDSDEFAWGFTQGVVLTGDNNQIGGTLPASRNVISGNTSGGILISGGSLNKIEGNFIGTNVMGTAALANEASGVTIIASDDNTIGGNAMGAENLISGNTQSGVSFIGTADDNSVLRNSIGTNKAGDAVIANTLRGVSMTSATSERNIIASNLVSGNTGGGILVGGTDNTIDLNLVGTDIDGDDAGMGNGSHGINMCCDAAQNLVGPEGNVIAHNSGRGIMLSGSGSGNKLDGNEIYDNSSLGIDLGGNGVTENDPADADGGNNQNNRLQNFPLIINYFNNGLANGSMNSVANTNFLIELFLSAECDPSGNGEGQQFAAFSSADTDVDGNGLWDGMPGFDPEKPFLTAIAINGTTDDTSEFSDCVEAIEGTPGIADLAVEKDVSAAEVEIDEIFEYSIRVSNNGPGFAVALELVDTLPDGVSFVDIAAPTNWTCEHLDGVATCTAPGLSISQTDEFTLTVRAESAGDAINSATISSAATDNIPENDTDTACNQVLDPGLVFANGFEEMPACDPPPVP